MEVIARGTTKRGGVKIQVEDWSENYPKIFKREATLAAYPLVVNQTGMPRNMQCAYRPGFDKMRIVYQFPDAETCDAAFRHLCEGTGEFSDYEQFLDDEYVQRLGNVELV